MHFAESDEHISSASVTCSIMMYIGFFWSFKDQWYRKESFLLYYDNYTASHIKVGRKHIILNGDKARFFCALHCIFKHGVVCKCVGKGMSLADMKRNLQCMLYVNA